jgi:hypothetical protein
MYPLHPQVISNFLMNVTRLADKKHVDCKKQEKMKEELKRWKKVLGLEMVTTTKPSTVVIFTDVDRENPDRMFSCELGLENGRYKLYNCEPPLKYLDNMETLLNKNNQLSACIVSLRKKFKENIS